MSEDNTTMPRKPFDLTGQRFGRLTVTSDFKIGSDKRRRWRCVCDCGSGAEVWVTTGNLKRTTSCGCAYGRQDLAGKRFGRLLALDYQPFQGPKQLEQAWRCQCDCGTIKVIRAGHLLAGTTMSCGCLRDEVVGTATITHGMKGHPIYNTWANMKARCLNPKAWAYKRYGGRGITVCQEWIDSFEAFFAAVGFPPGPDYSIDRIDNDRGYEPGNVRWATKSQQANNRQSTRMIEALGETKSIAEWVRDPRCRVKYGHLYARLDNDWDAEKAITTPAAWQHSRR